MADNELILVDKLVTERGRSAKSEVQGHDRWGYTSGIRCVQSFLCGVNQQADDAAMASAIWQLIERRASPYLYRRR